MEIEETINKWFDETLSKLYQGGLPKNKIDEMILASVPIIENYLNIVLVILEKGVRLPAMALLRISGEFIAKIIYCLKGNMQGLSVGERIESWEKTSFIKRKKFYENIKGRYSGNNLKKIHKWIDETENEINKISINALPETKIIFEEVFGEKHPIGREGMYLQYLGAVHLDLETVAKTIKKDKTSTEYMGDVEDRIKDLKFECLTHCYTFFREIYNYYKLDFQEIGNKYKTLIPES